MKYSAVVLGLAALAVASPVPEGVAAQLTPTGAAPAGCTASYPGSFEFTVVKPVGGSKLRKVSRTRLSHSLQTTR